MHTELKKYVSLLQGVLVVEKAVMSAKIEPGSQADDDRKIQKKIGITSAAKFGDLDSGWYNPV